MVVPFVVNFPTGILFRPSDYSQRHLMPGFIISGVSLADLSNIFCAQTPSTSSLQSQKPYKSQFPGLRKVGDKVWSKNIKSRERVMENGMVFVIVPC